MILRNPITFSKMIYTSIQTTEQSKTKGLKLKLHLLQFDLFPVDYTFLRKCSDKTLIHSSLINSFWLLVLNVAGLKTNFQNDLSIQLLYLSYSKFLLNHIANKFCIDVSYSMNEDILDWLISKRTSIIIPNLFSSRFEEITSHFVPIHHFDAISKNLRKSFICNKWQRKWSN